MCRLPGGRNNDGGALVEFAVTLPLVLLIMTGIFTFSIALWQKITLSEAMSVGGRLLAVDRGDTDPCKTVATSIYGAAPGLSQANLTLTFTLNGVNYGSGVTTCPGSSGGKNTNMVQGKTAMIQASYPVSLAVYGTQYSGISLGSQITEVIQ
jgi:Flp pilus assembly protein TadG